MNEEGMDMVLEQAWEDDIQNYGVPDETQRSGFGGERTSTEMNEASPFGEDERYGGCEDDEGEVGADNTDTAQQESDSGEKPAQAEAAGQTGELPEVPEVLRGEEGKEHPLLTRVREQARAREMERFLTLYPEVQAADIPREVWQQTAAGVPLVTAYAMHENQQLKMQLAAERQDKLNRQRTPGGLGANSGNELDELDRMWNEDD